MKYDLKRELSILDIPDEDECQKGGDLYNTNVVRPSALFKTMARRILEASLDDIRQRGSELNGALMVRKSRQRNCCRILSLTVNLYHSPSAQRCTKAEMEYIWHHSILIKSRDL